MLLQQPLWASFYDTESFLISPTDPILRALVSDCTYQICLYIYNILIHKSNLVKGHIICVDKRNNR